MSGTDEEVGGGQPVLGLLSGVIDHFRGDPIGSAGWAGLCLAALIFIAWLLLKALRPKSAETGDRLEIQGGWMPQHFGAGSPEERAAVPKPPGPGDGSGEVSRIEQSVARARLDVERLSSDMRVLRSSHKADQGKVMAKISALKEELAALSASFAAFSAKRAEQVGEGAAGPIIAPHVSAGISAEIASIVRDLHLE